MIKPFSKFLSALLFLMVVTVQSNAIRHVGNGGGLNEMKLLFIHQNFAQILSPCLNSYNFCSLTADEIKTLKNVVSHQADESNSSKITFSEKIFKPSDFETTRSVGSDVQVSSSALYELNDEPKSYTELIYLILQIRLYHLSLDIQHSSIAKKITSLNEETYTTNFKHFKIHNMRISEETTQVKNSYLSALFIEDSNGTYDITDKLLDLIGPIKKFEFNLLNSHSTPDSNSLTRYSMWGPLSNVIEKPEYNNSILVIELTLDSNNLVDEKSIILKLK